MFRIIKTSDGEILGMTEAPTFIKQAGNGCFITCPEPEASGIVFGGTPYQLLGREAMESEEGLETVMLETADSGVILAQYQQLAADSDAISVDHEYRLTLLELGVAEEV